MKNNHNCQAGVGPDKGRRGVGTDQGNSDHNQETASSSNPGVACPETVLVAAMTDGSYLLMAYPRREPVAFVARDHADLLRQALAGAFGISLEGGTRP